MCCSAESNLDDIVKWEVNHRLGSPRGIKYAQGGSIHKFINDAEYVTNYFGSTAQMWCIMIKQRKCAQILARGARIQVMIHIKSTNNYGVNTKIMQLVK